MTFMKIRHLLSLTLLTNLAFSQEAAPAPTAKLANESEASVVIVGGNSKAETYSAKQLSSYETGDHKVTLKGHYLMGKANSKTSAENWSIGLRYDFAFSPSIGLFAGETVSGDRFKNITRQYDTDVGAKYTVWKSGDKDYGLAELGYRLTRYDYNDPIEDKTTHFLRVYAEVAQAFNDKVYGKLWAEFLPNIERTSKYLVNFEPSLNVSLTETFAVKTGFLGQYDSEPSASKKFDYTYTLALIAKY